VWVPHEWNRPLDVVFNCGAARDSESFSASYVHHKPLRKSSMATSHSAGQGFISQCFAASAHSSAPRRCTGARIRYNPAEEVSYLVYGFEWPPWPAAFNRSARIKRLRGENRKRPTNSLWFGYVIRYLLLPVRLLPLTSQQPSRDIAVLVRNFHSEVVLDSLVFCKTLKPAGNSIPAI